MKALFLIPLLAGCASLGGNPNLTPEQLSAAAKDKNASVACGTGSGPWGKVNTVYVNVDKASLPGAASVAVDAECKVTITSGGLKP
jgi:hypothetical protein